MKRLFSIFLTVTLCTGLLTTAAAGSFQPEVPAEQEGFSAATESDDFSTSDNDTDTEGFSASSEEDEGNLLAETVAQVNYLDYDADTGQFVTAQAEDVIVIDENTTTWGDSGKETWYLARGTMTIPDMVTVNGTVNLILEDGCNLTVSENIYMLSSTASSSKNVLNIYAQSEGDSMGSLTPSGAPTSNSNEFYSAIGNRAPLQGSGYSLYDSALCVYGGIVTANSPDYAANNNEQFGILLDKIDIYGGIVNAYGSNCAVSSQIIASVYYSQLTVHGGTLNAEGGMYGIAYFSLTLNGGTVNASGTTSAVYAAESSAEDGICINDGTLNATGGSYGIQVYDTNFQVKGGTVNTSGREAGTHLYISQFNITGGTVNSSSDQTGIISERSTLNINGGIVNVLGNLSGGTYAGIDLNEIDHSPGVSESPSLIVDGGILVAEGEPPVNVQQGSSEYKNGIVMENTAGTVYATETPDSFTLTTDWTLEENKTLHVPENVTLTIQEGTTLTVEGALNILGTVRNEGDVYIDGDSGQITGTGTFEGNSAVQLGISLDRTSLSLTTGNTSQLTATVFPADTPVTWSSSNTGVATVSGSGLVTAVGSGTANITVSATINGSIYNATCTVSVSAPYYPVTDISLDQSSLALDKGTSTTLHATVTPSYATNRTVTWSSSNTDVATVSGSGTVTAVGPGTAVITASAGGCTATCTVTVSVPITGITLSPATLDLAVNGQETLTAAVEPADADQTVTWTSDNPAVTSVDASGTVTGVGKGTAVVTATTADGAYQASCTVTVPAQPASTVLSVTDRTTSSVTLSWDAVEEAEGYTIWYRSEDDTDMRRTIIWDKDTTSWTRNGLEPGTKYFFAIRSWVTDADGNYIFSDVSPTQRGTTKPEAASIQSVSVSDGYVKVRLDGEAEGAERYSMCYASRSNGFTSGNFQVGIHTSYTIRTMTEPLDKGTWYICVKSYRNLGNSKRVYGNWSNVVKITVE